MEEHHNHWAVGWVDGYAIRVYRDGKITEAFRTWHDLQARMNDYLCSTKRTTGGGNTKQPWKTSPMPLGGSSTNTICPRVGNGKSSPGCGITSRGRLRMWMTVAAIHPKMPFAEPSMVSDMSGSKRNSGTIVANTTCVRKMKERRTQRGKVMCDDMPDFEDFDDEADDDDDDFPDFDDDWDRDSSGPAEVSMENNEATEINDVAPSSLSHLIGQRGVIDQVRVALDAAQMDNKKFDHALLVGPPGMGKSALAAVIAQEMATDFHEVLGQSIKNAADLNTLLLMREGQGRCPHRRVPRTQQRIPNGSLPCR